MTKIIPDTSIIIEGLCSRMIESGELTPQGIIIHEAVIAELEAQANRGREIGVQGLEEIKKLRELSIKKDIDLEFKGTRPGDFEIKHAKSGEIDSVIREIAGEEDGALITGDKVQAMVAESKGIHVILVEFEEEEKPFILAQYFDETTMSVHLRENTTPKAKKGRPGAWKFVEVGNDKLEKEFMKELCKEVVREAKINEEGFIELDRRGSTVLQIGSYRIVITRPPFSDGYEITAVRPVKSLTLDEYKLSDKLNERIEKQAEGILIAGAPGHGKTTFATALALFYLGKNKIIKTVEAPRDLKLPDEITQLSMSHGSNQEIHDVLLLSRPDYTIFDEMRNTNDFVLFSDLRLSGVGMVGVIHATNPIDAIQRFIGRIELGVIPHVIDTVIFIRHGAVNRVFSVKMEVKVPAGMTEADLARPIVVVNDFDTGKSEFEIYSYGDQTIVVPIAKEQRSPTHELAAQSIENEFKKMAPKVKVDIVNSNKAVVYVPEQTMSRIIGKGGKHIEAIEKKLGINIDLKDLDDQAQESISYDVTIDKKSIRFFLDESLANKEVFIYVDGLYLLKGQASKKGIVNLVKGNKLGKILVNAINNEDDVEVRV
ncbi:MAG: PINc/VapC family ATPase [Nanoarchaeota archaeon]|nr:PINc/VapC family ATPase [Nanoarchaeota archaeon]